MEQKLFTLFARTPVHVGAGNSVGAIDSPITRERHTRIPLIPGSALKGVLSDFWNGTDKQAEQGELFGKADQAGKLLIGEGRTLAFPVRSAKGSFAWITCPLALRRFQRDSGRKFDIPAIKGTMDCIAGKELIFEGKNAVLEEYVLNVQNSDKLDGIVNQLQALSDDPVWKMLNGHLAIISDEMFSYFVENACEVVTRIRIDDKTGVVADGALFNQEQLPSETMLYAVIAVQRAGDGVLEKLQEMLEANGNQLQVGGDETIGLGYCSTKLL